MTAPRGARTAPLGEGVGVGREVAASRFPSPRDGSRVRVRERGMTHLACFVPRRAQGRARPSPQTGSGVAATTSSRGTKRLTRGYREVPVRASPSGDTASDITTSTTSRTLPKLTPELRAERAAGRETYNPPTFEALVGDAAVAIEHALQDGETTMEVEFPALSGVDSYKGASDSYIDANLQASN